MYNRPALVQMWPDLEGEFFKIFQEAEAAVDAIWEEAANDMPVELQDSESEGEVAQMMRQQFQEAAGLDEMKEDWHVRLIGLQLNLDSDSSEEEEEQPEEEVLEQQTEAAVPEQHTEHAQHQPAAEGMSREEMLIELRYAERLEREAIPKFQQDIMDIMTWIQSDDFSKAWIAPLKAIQERVARIVAQHVPVAGGFSSDGVRTFAEMSNQEMEVAVRRAQAFDSAVEEVSQAFDRAREETLQVDVFAKCL